MNKENHDKNVPSPVFFTPRRVIPAVFVTSLCLFSLLTSAYQGKVFPLAVNENRISDHPERYGGTLIWGTINAPTTMNPLLSTHSVSVSIHGLIFNRLVRLTPQREAEPDLAERWDVSADGLVYTFYLRKGVLFHDGKECTADDVLFTYLWHADPQNDSSSRSHLDLVKEFKAIDKYTFRIVLSEPFPPLVHKLVQEILPKHILGGTELTRAKFNDHPVGTGPFRFKRWDKKTNEIELEANTQYREGRPYLDKIVVKVYPDNSSLWAALMRREVDFVKFINREDYLILQNDPTFKTYEIPLDHYLAMAFNHHDPQLFDKSIRYAIAQAIDVEKIMESISGGGIRSTGPFHPQSPGFDPGVKAIPYNPIKARMELMARGWWDKNGDGILEKGARDLTFRLLVNGRSDYYKRMAMMVRQQLSEVGIKTEVQLYYDEEELTDGYLDKNKPQAWLRLFMGHYHDMYNSLGSWYSHSSEPFKLWNYRNEEVDRLFEQTRIMGKDNTGISLYREIHKIIYRDQPACFLFFPLSYHAVSASLKNTDDLFTMEMADYVIKNWYIDKPSQQQSALFEKKMILPGMKNHKD